MIGQSVTLQEIVRKTTDLPTIPQAALKVIHLTELGTTNAQIVAQTIAQDQALSMRVLRLANSAYFGMSRQIGELREAVVVLGMKSVRQLATVAATFPWMSKPLKGYALGPKQLWNHSFGMAVGAQLVAKRARLPQDETVFTAGLLGDMGKTALSVWLESKLGGMLKYASDENVSFDEAERAVLGYDHCEVGRYLADNWNLPLTISDAIRYHHSPNQADDNQVVVDCVHIGNYLTMALGFGLGGDGLHYTFYDESLRRLGLNSDDLDRVAEEFVVEFERYEDLFKELTAA